MDAALTPAARERLAAHLAAQHEPLYAVLDAARDERVYEIVTACSEECASLYEGLQGEVLAPYAPWLVRLSPGSALLEGLIYEGWGRSWGVYLTSGARFRDVRRHLRRFLMVKTEEGKKLYFRFYDPRVLRVFLPTCTPRQVSLLFGDVASYLMEAKRPDVLLTFAAGEAGGVAGTSVEVMGSGSWT